MELLSQMKANLVPISGGTFSMGNDKQLRERPEHIVTVGDFELSKYQVTQSQWMAVMGENPSHFQGALDLPVDQVSWEMAQQFLQKLNHLTGERFRLPSESEWEFAARGGNFTKGYLYAGSDALGDVAWYNGNSGFETHPIGLKMPNELGLYDICGNVWEWCAERVPKDFENPNRIPTWEENANSNDRVLRGGSYINYAVFSRSTYRWIDRPDNVENYIGLRIGM